MYDAIESEVKKKCVTFFLPIQAHYQLQSYALKLKFDLLHIDIYNICFFV